jgi:2-polyprenyl-6-methoxyphenol hydroxylase-like FAD-dependent oxidoreductase
VRLDRLHSWHVNGLLCIGDAAHAMSPAGGVGINLAIQDAVAAANLLWRPLRARSVSEDVLRKVQERREIPTRATQQLQLFIQNRVISNVLALKTRPSAPFAVKLLDWLPVLRRIPARLLGLGFRPEHVRTPQLPPES